MVTQREIDVVVVGAGPNGLAAAITMARAGCSALILEANTAGGGGARSEELTLPGFIHDTCSAVHPIAAVSPFFQELPLAPHGLRWCPPPVALAHPLDVGFAACLYRGVEETAATLGEDAGAYRKWITPFQKKQRELFRDLLRPFHLPRHP